MHWPGTQEGDPIVVSKVIWNSLIRAGLSPLFMVSELRSCVSKEVVLSSHKVSWMIVCVCGCVLCLFFFFFFFFTSVALNSCFQPSLWLFPHKCWKRKLQSAYVALHWLVPHQHYQHLLFWWWRSCVCNAMSSPFLTRLKPRKRGWVWTENKLFIIVLGRESRASSNSFGFSYLLARWASRIIFKASAGQLLLLLLEMLCCCYCSYYCDYYY